MSLNVRDADGVKLSVKTTISGLDHVPHHVVESSALPTGAATEATLAAIAADVASPPLPVGATTESTLTSAKVAIELGAADKTKILSGSTADITNTADTLIIAAPGVGQEIVVTGVFVCNSHASVGTWVNIKKGSTVIATGYVPPLGGAPFVWTPRPGVPCGDNVALNIACETTGSNVRACAVGVKTAI